MLNTTAIHFGLALGIVGLLAGCGQQPATPASPAPPAADSAAAGPAPTARQRAAPAFTLTNADADRALRLQQGEVVEVRLAADRVSGYTWIPSRDVRPMMSTDGVPQYEVDENTGPGAPGTEIWRFIALEPGHVHLVFEYRRPLESNAAPAEVIVFHFDIE